MKRFILLALVISAGPREIAAQLPSLFPAHHYLVDTWYPTLGYSGRNGFSAGGFYGVVHPLDFAAEDFRPPYMWSVSVKAAAATRGSRFLTIKGSFPAAIPGWRLNLQLTTQRSSREDYFGLGNNPDFDSRNLPGALDELNWADRLSTFARGEAQKYISRNFRVLAGFHAEHWRLTPISGASQLGMDLSNGLDPRIGIGTNDVTSRIGLIYDSRNDEVAPRSGVLIEGILGVADASVMGDLTYRRMTLSTAGYLPVGNRFVLAGRLLAQNVDGDQAIGSLYLIETEQRPLRSLGGSRTHRGLPNNSLLGPGKLLLNFDLRYDVFPYPSLLPITLVGWVDAGRVFYNQTFELTLNEMKVGGGGGFFIQIGRSGIIGITAGIGPAGIQPNIHTRWPF